MLQEPPTSPQDPNTGSFPITGTNNFSDLTDEELEERFKKMVKRKETLVVRKQGKILCAFPHFKSNLLKRIFYVD